MSKYDGALKPLRANANPDGFVDVAVVLTWLRGEPVGSAVLTVDEALRLASGLIEAARVSAGVRR